MRVATIGAGYVGLVAGTCLSDAGNQVAIVDSSHARIKLLNSGRVPIYEPGLDEMIASNVKEGRLTFSTDLPSAVSQADVVILAVGTPARPDGWVDMRAMDASAKQVAKSLRNYTVIVNKSTVPVGTHKRITQIVSSLTSVPFDYVANPEFLKEGHSINDFLSPDRVILGLTSDRALQIMKHLYAPFMRRNNRLLVMDPTSAELTKYACNTMLATRIAFMNDMSQLCERLGADIELIRQGMGSDHRIGPDFLFPSLGFGGSCFPKDIKALMTMGKTCNHPMRIVEAVHLANEEQRESMFKKVQLYFEGRLINRKFAVWGLAFKARTDDVRESPALTLIQRLVCSGARVAAHDPKAIEPAREFLGENGIEYCRDMYEALPGASALIICTEWQEYRTPDFNRIRSLLGGSVVFDGRNLYDLDWMRETGLTYVSVGRPVVNPRPADKG